MFNRKRIERLENTISSMQDSIDKLETQVYPIHLSYVGLHDKTPGPGVSLVVSLILNYLGLVVVKVNDPNSTYNFPFIKLKKMNYRKNKTVPIQSICKKKKFKK